MILCDFYLVKESKYVGVRDSACVPTHMDNKLVLWVRLIEWVGMILCWTENDALFERETETANKREREREWIKCLL